MDRTSDWVVILKDGVKEIISRVKDKEIEKGKGKKIRERKDQFMRSNITYDF